LLRSYRAKTATAIAAPAVLEGRKHKYASLQLKMACMLKVGVESQKPEGQDPSNF